MFHPWLGIPRRNIQKKKKLEKPVKALGKINETCWVKMCIFLFGITLGYHDG